MLVHPSESAEAIQETTLLFKDKNIYIITAQIGDFLQACHEDLTAFKASKKKFYMTYSSIERKLKQLVRDVGNGTFEYEDMHKYFTGKQSSDLAMTAIIDFMSDPGLYDDLGGKLLAPSNFIDYDEFHKLTQAIIWLANKHGYTSDNMRNRFYDIVLSQCIESPYVWDFNYAKSPFIDVLSIHPKVGTQYFDKRIKHIRRILQWSAERIYGKCWATWKAFVENIEWLSESDMTALVKLVEEDNDFDFDYVSIDDKRWLRQLLSSPKMTTPLKDRITKLIHS